MHRPLGLLVLGFSLNCYAGAARDARQKPGTEVVAELRSYNTKLEAAMIKIDPKVEPLLARLDAAHPHQP